MCSEGIAADISMAKWGNERVLILGCIQLESIIDNLGHTTEFRYKCGAFGFVPEAVDTKSELEKPVALMDSNTSTT